MDLPTTLNMVIKFIALFPFVLAGGAAILILFILLVDLLFSPRKR